MNSSAPLKSNESFIQETTRESQKCCFEQKSHKPESIYWVISFIRSSRTGKTNTWGQKLEQWLLWGKQIDWKGVGECLLKDRLP